MSDYGHGSWAAVLALLIIAAAFCFLAVTCTHTCSGSGGKLDHSVTAPDGTVTEVCAR